MKLEKNGNLILFRETAILFYILNTGFVWVGCFIFHIEHPAQYFNSKHISSVILWYQVTSLSVLKSWHDRSFWNLSRTSFTPQKQILFWNEQRWILPFDIWSILPHAIFNKKSLFYNQFAFASISLKVSFQTLSLLTLLVHGNLHIKWFLLDLCITCPSDCRRSFTAKRLKPNIQDHPWAIRV